MADAQNVVGPLSIKSHYFAQSELGFLTCTARPTSLWHFYTSQNLKFCPAGLSFSDFTSNTQYKHDIYHFN